MDDGRRDKLEREAKRARRFTPVELSIFAAIAVLLASLSYLIWCAAGPDFRPYRAERFEVVPDRACVGEAVRFRVTRSISGEFGRLQSRLIGSEWRWDHGADPSRPAEVPETVPSEGGGLPREIEPSPTTTVTSGYVRPVPPYPGSWKLVSESLVTGSVGPVGRDQAVTLVTEDSLEVSRQAASVCDVPPDERSGVVGVVELGGSG